MAEFPLIFVSNFTQFDAVNSLWRNSLCFFVLNFTEFDAVKLFKLYRNTAKNNAKEHK